MHTQTPNCTHTRHSTSAHIDEHMTRLEGRVSFFRAHLPDVRTPLRRCGPGRLNSHQTIVCLLVFYSPSSHQTMSMCPPTVNGNSFFHLMFSPLSSDHIWQWGYTVYM